MRQSLRERMGYKGPVRRVREERFVRDAPGAVNHQEVVFDPSGNRVPPIPLEIRADAAGGRIETVKVAGSDVTAIPGLYGVGLPTAGAAVAETIYTHQAPVATVFRGLGGQELHRVVYITDSRQRIVELNSVNFVMPIRVTCQYDEHGHVLKQCTYLFGELDYQVTYSYNEHGDIETTLTNDHQPPAHHQNAARHQYEYDSWNNWIRQTVYHPAAITEYRRWIEYEL